MDRRAKTSARAAITYIGSAFTASAALFFLIDRFTGLQGGFQIWTIVLLSVILVLLTFHFSVWQALHVHRRSYGLAFKKTAEAFDVIHDELRGELDENARVSLSFDIDAADIVKALQRYCRRLADAFETITSRDCHVCIKIIKSAEDGEVEVPETTDGGSLTIRSWIRGLFRSFTNREVDEIDGATKTQVVPNPILYTLCRSDPARSYIEDETTVLDNTAFMEALPFEGSPTTDAFFCNVLPFLRKYQNVSAERYYHNNLGRFNTPNRLFRYIWWKLPYKSTIVVPITFHNRESEVRPMATGFLCVDSKPLCSFVKRYDLPLLRGAAEGIYNLMHLLSIRTASNGEATEVERATEDEE